MHSSTEKHSFLTTYELWWVALTALALLLIGNARFLLERLGLINASSVVHQQVAQTVGTGLGRLDTFTITPTVVTFLVWGGAGLILFSIIQGLLRASGTVQFERDLSSDRYIHPAGFSRASYWRRVIENTVISFVLLALLVTGAVGYVVYITPVSIDYLQVFLLNISLHTLPDLLASILVACTGTLVLYCLLKLAIWHHRLVIR